MKKLKRLFTLALTLCMLLTSSLVSYATTAQSVTDYVGYQKMGADTYGKYSLRLIGSVNAIREELEGYDSVGFDVVLIYADRTDWNAQTGSFLRKTVYSSIISDGIECTPASMDLSDGYFFVLPINGLYSDVGDLNLKITTFYVKDGVKTSAATETVTVENTADTTKDIFVPDGATPATNEAVLGAGNYEYKLADGAYEYAYTNVSSDSYSGLHADIVEAGYTLYAENSIDGNLFKTYVKDYKQINTAYYPTLENGSLRVVYSPKGYLPATAAPEYETLKPTSITQLATESSKESAPGENYVIQLADGSFIIIDGGHWKTEDVNALYNFLYANKPDEHDKPHVTWMLTHAHPDHIQLTRGFLDTYSNNIVLDMICYNFPKFPIYASATEANEAGGFVYDEYSTPLNGVDKNGNPAGINNRVDALFNMLDTKYPNTEHYIFHSGDVLYLADCKIEFLHTHEDIFPTTINTLNKTSSVWKMSFKSSESDTLYGGKSFLVLGDSEWVNCDFMAGVYSDVLDSDIVQAAHHGLNGATEALYTKIKPEIVFWPINSARGVSVSGSNNDIWDNSANHAWLNDTNIKHYFGDVTTTVYSRTLVAVDGAFDGLSSNTGEMIWDLEA